MVVATVLVAVATMVGLVALWPTGDAPRITGTAADLAQRTATVTGVEATECFDPLEGFEVRCDLVTARLTSGPDQGEEVTFLRSSIDLRTPELHDGDRLVLVYNPLAPPDFQYSFFDYQRDTPLLLLGGLFALVVIAFGRWQGVRALLGLGASLAVILGFLLPALLRAEHAVAVALVATGAIAFLALYLAHGISLTTTVALLGTLASVVVITFLAVVVVHLANLTGIADESVQTLSITASALDPTGILVAGMVIGALGVLDDVTVTQVSAVAELHRADPRLRTRRLYRAAIRIGRDHVASTVNTLVLAYAGASLSLMLLFSQEGRAFSQVLTQEVVAVELVRMLVGSIGLVLSVPLTTALAVAVVEHRPLRSIHHHGHQHSGPGRRARGRDDGPSWDDFAPEVTDLDDELSTRPPTTAE
jgi:uncharacterized membrane protein